MINQNQVPDELATPTQVVNADAEADAINKVLASVIALYYRTKGAHWHVFGHNFFQLHSMFDAQADQLSEAQDTLAELVRQIGKITVCSIADVMELSGDDGKSTVPFTPKELVFDLLGRNRALQSEIIAAIKVCDSSDDFAASNKLQEFLAECNKRIWFLYETSVISLGGA